MPERLNLFRGGWNKGGTNPPRVVGRDLPASGQRQNVPPLFRGGWNRNRPSGRDLFHRSSLFRGGAKPSVLDFETVPFSEARRRRLRRGIARLLVARDAAARDEGRAVLRLYRAGRRTS